MGTTEKFKERILEKTKRRVASLETSISNGQRRIQKFQGQIRDIEASIELERVELNENQDELLETKEYLEDLENEPNV